MSNNSGRIYVGNLPGSATREDVEGIFHRYGRVRSVDVKLSRGEVRGGRAFAFVEFEDPRDADDAVSERDGFEYRGSRIRVEYPHGESRDRRRNFQGRSYWEGDGIGRGRPPVLVRHSAYRVKVFGLPTSGSWQDLKDHCKAAGDVCFSDVFRDGTGVVEFASKSDMINAVKTLDDSKFRSHEGDSAYIRVKEDYYERGRYSRSRSHSPRRRVWSRSGSDSRSRSRSPQYEATREREAYRGKDK